MPFRNVLQAIDDIKNGKMVVMIDDENRENEGDIVCAAAFCDSQKVNFMITHAKGVLCAPLTSRLAKKFELEPMVRANTSQHETAFTISIDAKNAKTGVSADERNMTIKMLVNPATKANDFVRPGHIFPLIAKSGGVLERTGHTEGSVDLCHLAGLAPVAVICEIVKDDGSMARKPDLEIFCKEHGLNMISVREIIEYRLHHESLITLNKPKKSSLAGFKALSYEISDHTNAKHYAFVFGQLSQNKSVNVKFHRIGDDLSLLKSVKFKELMEDLKILNDEGGVAVFLSPQADESTKSYGIGAQILLAFKLKNITLLSKNKNREFAALSGFGLNITAFK